MKCNRASWGVLAVLSGSWIGCGAGAGDEACGPFPNAPEGYGASIHVDAACVAAGSPDGSVKRPYTTIADAIAHASDGTAILLAAGT